MLFVVVDCCLVLMVVVVCGSLFQFVVRCVLFVGRSFLPVVVPMLSLFVVVVICCRVV